MKKASTRKSSPASKGSTRRAASTDVGDLIAMLSSVCGPPGREDEVRKRILEEITRRTDHIEISPLGALHAVMRRDGHPHLMLTAHMDEVGVIVSNVDPSGFARFGLLGTKDATSLVGHTVRFSRGRIAVIRSHAGSEKPASTVDDLLLDFGSAEGGPAAIAVGEVGCLDSRGHRLGDQFVASNAGGRSCVAALIRTLHSIGRSTAALQFAFSVQGEFGGDAGLTSVAALGPQAACVVSPAPADDMPHKRGHAIKLGGGPVIAVRHGETSSDLRFVQALASLAEKRKISYQLGTFADQLPGSGLPAAGGGARTIWLCIPCRGLGTSAEMVDLADVEKTARLLAALGGSQLEWM